MAHLGELVLLIKLARRVALELVVQVELCLVGQRHLGVPRQPRNSMMALKCNLDLAPYCQHTRSGGVGRRQDKNERAVEDEHEEEGQAKTMAGGRTREGFSLEEIEENDKTCGKGLPGWAVRWCRTAVEHTETAKSRRDEAGPQTPLKA